jgi:hypothetical protein
MRPRPTVLPVALLLTVAACGDGGVKMADDVRGRLDAATHISDLDKRDDALADIAVDAAEKGEVDTAGDAIDKIQKLERRRDVAAKCATKLADRGNTDGATSMAMRIDDIPRRNEVLAKIARK